MKNIIIKHFFISISLITLAISNPFPVFAKEYVVLGINFPPLMYEQDGKPAGFYYEMLLLIQKKMPDMNFKTKFYPTPRMFKVLQQTPGTFSLGIARTPEREALYKWAGPSITTIKGLYKLKSRSDIRIESEAAVKQYKIGTGRAYAFIQMLMLMGVPESQIDVVNNDVQNLIKLYKGRIDLMATLDIVFLKILKQTDYRWEEFEMAYLIGKSDMYYAFNRDFDDHFIRRFQEALDQVRKTKEYSELVRKYQPE